LPGIEELSIKRVFVNRGRTFLEQMVAVIQPPQSGRCSLMCVNIGSFGGRGGSASGVKSEHLSQAYQERRNQGANLAMDRSAIE
jgi:hypothetical protein